MKKKAIKFFKYFFIIFIAALLSLYIIGNLAEKKITSLAFNELKSSLEVPVGSGDISFTLIKRFPLATIEFNNIRVGTPVITEGGDSVASVSDTLIRIGKLYISVKSTPLIDGVFDVQKVEVIGADIDFKIDKNGKSNFDFFIDTTTSETPDTTISDPLDLTLQKLLLKDITCHYSDSLTTTKAKINIPEIILRGKIKKDIYSGFIKGSVLISESNFKDTYLDRMRETKVGFEMGFENDTLKINSFDIVTDGAMISATGISVLKDEVYSDINIKGENIDLAELIKYVPEDSLKEYSIDSIKGNISFDVSLKGVVSDSLLQPHVDVSVNLKEGAILTSNYPALRSISFIVNATNGEQQNERTTKVDIHDLQFSTGSSNVNLNVSVNNFEKLRYNVKTNINLSIPDFNQFIPDSLIKEIRGRITAQFSTKGVMPDSIDDNYIEYLLQTSRAKVTLSDINVSMDSLPAVKSFSGTFNYLPNRFNASGISVSIPDYNVNIKNSSFNTLLSGKLLQPEKTSINITSFVFNTDSSQFSGKASVQNLNAPSYSINTKIKLNLAEVKNMLPDSLISDMSGIVTSTITSSGELNLDSIAEQINDIVFNSSSFTFNMNNLSVAMPDTLMCISNLSGGVWIIPDTITIDKLAGTYKDIDFDVSNVKVVNVYNTILKNMHEQLYVEGAFNFGDIDYNYFAPLVDTTSTSEGDETALNENSNDDNVENLIDDEIVNYTFLVKAKLSVNSLKYEKADIKNISALFKLQDSLYIIDQIKFNAFNGDMNSSVRVDFKPEDEMEINTKHIVEGMDVKLLLEDFNNFSEYGNDYIQSDNLSGILSTELYTKVVMVGDSVMMNKMRVKGDFKLEKGGIYNYKPAMEMAEFTGLKELDNIRFKTLKTKMFMFKNKLYIPSTDIVSSAMDVSFFGMESMGDDYEYHVDLRLREVLKGKSKRLLKRQAEVGNDVSDKDLDRGSVKLIYADVDGKSKVGFDSKKAIRKMQLKIKVQSQMLDLIFNPKVVSFDTGVK